MVHDRESSERDRFRGPARLRGRPGAQAAAYKRFAGIQIAITQPIHIGDVAIVENEWGWIEEITGPTS